MYFKLLEKNIKTGLNFLFNTNKRSIVLKFSRDLSSSRLINRRLNKMIRIRLNETEKLVNISVTCKITESIEKQFNLNRSLDEPISATFQKLYTNFLKQVNAKDSKSNKKMKKDENIPIVKKPDEDLPVFLYNQNNEEISTETLNKNAWKNDFTFKIKEQSFKVTVNLPFLKKIAISKQMIAGLAAIAKIEIDADPSQFEKVNENSKYKWYYSDKEFEKSEIDKFTKDNLEWILMEEGRNLKSCVLHECTQNRYIKVIVIPSDGERDGRALEAISKDPVLEKVNINEFPMTYRHKMTDKYLASDRLRVMSYNVLANCYSDTAAAKEHLFSHCPLEYLDFRYRRILLVHEIKNYKADIIFLQECENDFLEEDLKSSMSNYQALIKTKIGSKEGSGTLFRKDRFKYIQSHDISIIDELKSNPLFEKLWENISQNPEFKKSVLERNTIFQITQVESIDFPGKHFLLCNTHLFFHPSADFTRLLQAIVCAKCVENLKFKLIMNDEIKDANILFGGDFNSDPPSHAFTYLASQSIPFNNLTEDEKIFIKGAEEDLTHSISLSAHADFPYTNYTVGFIGVLDYIFYETNAFELEKVIPIPSVDKIKETIAMPSKFLPSDHVALVFDLKIK